MISRMTGPAIILSWLAAMSWLFWNDVIPAWTAQAPPANATVDDIPLDQEEQQYAIFDANGVRIGSLWTQYIKTAERLRRVDTAHITKPPIRSMPALLVEVDSTFDEDHRLDELAVDIFGAGFPIELRGERFGDQMGFHLDAGPIKRNFRLEDESSGMVGDCFKPFSTLPNLEVGQSWKMQVFNPIAAILPNMGDRFIPMLVKVTGTEEIATRDGIIECFLVEAKNARAWVGPNGNVYKQQAEIPMGGEITIIPEPFDAERLKQSRLEGIPPAEY